MNRLDGLKEPLQSNLNYLAASTLIITILVVYVLFFVFVISPELQARDKWAAQVNDARKLLVAAHRIQDEPPASLQARLASARSTLTAVSGIFLSDAQASQVVNAFYQHARDSGVSLTDLQVQPSSLAQASPTRVQRGAPAPAPYSIATIQLQAQGTSRQLVAFVSRLKEASAKGVVVNNLSIVDGEETATATLTLNASLYVSTEPFWEGTATRQLLPSAVPSPSAGMPPSTPGAPTATPTLPPVTPTSSVTATLVMTATPTGTATPTATATATPPPTSRYTIHVVRPGDTLYSLARRYGTTVDAIMAANQLTDSNIRVGQQLLIPSP